MKYLAQIILAAALLALAACTTNTVISDDASAKELIQRGQEAYEKSRNKEALAYFTAVVDRYGSDPALYIEARYEIAHLYMKRKNYEAAAPVLQEIIKLYANYPIGTFPASYQKLAQLELAKIPEDKLAAINAKNRAKAEQEDQLKAAELEALMRQAQEAEAALQAAESAEIDASE